MAKKAYEFTCKFCGSHYGSFEREFGEWKHKNLLECIGILKSKIEDLEKTQELTDDQIAQIDTINNIAFRAIKELLPEKTVEWDMEWIGVISDCLCNIAVKYFGKTEMEIYPYIDTKEN